jgi:NADH-quinone oxidoreductase subunit E
MKDTKVSAPDVGRASEILESHGINVSKNKKSGSDELLIPLLQDLQDAYGYLPQDVLSWVSDKTGIPVSRMYGVITFYTQFYLEPKGRHIIRCCEGTACHVKGGKRIAESIVDELEIEEGETTEDMKFTFETVQCLGTCFLAPVVMIDGDYYGEMTKEKLVKALKRYE